MRHTIILLFLLIDAALAEDKGLGLVYFSERGPMSNAFQSDSIVILHSRNESSRVVATFVLTIQPENRGYQYKVSSLSQLYSENIIEYAYEVSGLPIDGVDTSANWLRVVYGFSKQGTPLRGWVKLQRPRYDILLWSTELQKHPLFFSPEPKTPELYNHPGGEKARFRPERVSDSGPQRFNYILHPIRVQGSWMQVHVVSPSDFCDQPAAPRSGDFWIRYLDNNGRPLVYYYTRGC
jgi:hypothetical protein